MRAGYLRPSAGGPLLGGKLRHTAGRGEQRAVIGCTTRAPPFVDCNV
jgi:hypothetical protein